MSGSETLILFWNRLRKPASKVHGLLVAPITYSFDSFDFPLIPSISVRNWFFTLTSPPTSLFLVPNSESISSIKRRTGIFSFSFSFRAIENNFDTFFSASPSHLLIIEAASTLIKYPSISAAAAAANNVLPHPGGPYNNIPLGQPKGNRSALLVGYTIDSLIARFASSRPITSFQVTSGFSFIIRSSKSAFKVSILLLFCFFWLSDWIPAVLPLPFVGYPLS